VKQTVVGPVSSRVVCVFVGPGGMDIAPAVALLWERDTGDIDDAGCASLLFFRDGAGAGRAEHLAQDDEAYGVYSADWPAEDDIPACTTRSRRSSGGPCGSPTPAKLPRGE
jgi:hypothetical protein